jgi:hypothetical protein
MNSAEHTTLASWYLGELGGEARFLALAASSSDRARARKWETLAALEQETARRIAEVLATSQDPLPTENTDDDYAKTRIADLSNRPWHEQMSWLRDIAAEALEEMTREAAQLSLEMRPLVDYALAHERALVEFSIRELAGNENDSLQCVHRLLEPQSPQLR